MQFLWQPWIHETSSGLTVQQIRRGDLRPTFNWVGARQIYGSDQLGASVDRDHLEQETLKDHKWNWHHLEYAVTSWCQLLPRKNRSQSKRLHQLSTQCGKETQAEYPTQQDRNKVCQRQPKSRQETVELGRRQVPRSFQFNALQRNCHNFI